MNRTSGYLSLALALAMLGGLSWAAPPTPPELTPPPMERGPASSQTMEEEKNFFLQVMQLVFNDQEESAKTLILEKRELARQTFAFFLKTYNRLGDERQKKVTARFLNLIAVTFRDQLGEKQLLATLKKHKLLSPERPKVTSPGENEAVESLESAFKLAARYGNSQGERRLADLLIRVRGKSDEQALQLLDDRVVDGAYLALSGQCNAALATLSALQGEVQKRGQPEQEFRYFLGLVEASRGVSRPEGVEANLPSLLAAAQRVRTYKGHLFRYVAKTWTHRALVGSAGDVLANCKADIQELEGYAPEGDTLFDGRIFAEASLFWIDELALWARASAADRSLQRQLLDQIAKIQAKAVSLEEASHSLTGSFDVDYNPEFSLAALEIRLKALDSQLEADALGPVRSQLSLLNGSLNVLDKQFKAQEQSHQRDAGRVLERSQGLEVDPDGVRFSVVDGDFSRLGYLYHRLWGKLIQAEQGFSKDELALEAEAQIHLGLAEKYQEQQSRGQGYQGLSDSAWDRLDGLLHRRPNQWALSAENLLTRAMQINESLQYQPGLIQALAYQARLYAAEGKTMEASLVAQRAVDMLASYLTESAPDGLGWEQACEDSAHYDCLRGNAEGTLMTLDRLQQLRTLVELSQEAAPGDLGLLARARKRLASLQSEAMQRRSLRIDSYPLEVPLGETRAETLVLQNRLRQLSPRNENLLATVSALPASIQKQLPKNGAAVQYFSAEEALYIFVVSNHDTQMRRVEITRGEISAMVGKFQRLLRTPPNSNAPLSWKDSSEALLAYKDAASALHRILIDPIEPDIADKEILAFVPDDAVRGMPFEALGRLNPDKGLEFLVERKACLTLYRLGDLDRSTEDKKPEPGLIALAEADDHTADTVYHAIPSASNASHEFVGAEASFERVSPLPANVGYLYLGLPVGPEGLSFAGDRRIGLSQFGQWKLDGVRLVTFPRNHGEGAFPSRLAESVLTAGGGATLINRWPIPAPISEALLVGFYKKLLEGKNPAQALQATQQVGLNSHPFFWANFGLYGAWR